MEDNKIRQRHEIPASDKWAIEDLYATEEYVFYAGFTGIRLRIERA